MAADALFTAIDKRTELDLEDGDQAYFNGLMLKLEYLTKVTVAGVVACVDEDENRHRYSLEHKLVRANSLGDWTEALNTALVGPPAQFFLSDARVLTRDLTEQVDSEDWRHGVVRALSIAAAEIGLEYPLGTKVALRQFFDIAVQLRNRTRGHGAPTSTQCGRSCSRLKIALEDFTRNCKLFAIPWAYLHRNLSGKYRVTPLQNDCSSFDYLKRTSDGRLPNGVYLNLPGNYDATIPVHVPLLFVESSIIDIAVPNGNYKAHKFEALSYVTNDIVRVDGSVWAHPPARLPRSETEGASILGTLGSTFTNVPPAPERYVPRLELERRLVEELRKVDRHPIVTLTGPGGIGKTTIALKAIHEICNLEAPPYEVILWISARDIDLLDSGPKPVSRRVFSQRDISLAVTNLLEPVERSEKQFRPNLFLQKCLSEGAAGSTLFILDNFETLQNPADIVAWIDAHVRSPNKVLITTRFRDFIGDYPIEIGGMSDGEAIKLIDQHAEWLNVDKLLSSSYKEALIEESEGHPYVIKILLGQVAREQRAIAPERIVATAEHLLSALFKRTYNALSPAAQRVFLLLCSWKVFVPEIAVEAVSLRPGAERFDVPGALDELMRFSLVEHSVSGKDGERFIGVPLAAAIFGQRELEVSSFKVAVEGDRRMLVEFGGGTRKDANRGVLPRIDRFVKSIANQIDSGSLDLEQAVPILEYIASRVPVTYMRLADLVQEIGDGNEFIERAKSYVRSFLIDAAVPERYGAWLRLAELSRRSGDPIGEIHALSEAALLPTSNLTDLGELANTLNARIRNLKDRWIEEARSSEARELLAKVAEKMENHLRQLSATECSRLAWLYLNIGNKARALDVARIGSERDPDNDYCRRLIERMGSY